MAHNSLWVDSKAEAKVESLLGDLEELQRPREQNVTTMVTSEIIGACSVG